MDKYLIAYGTHTDSTREVAQKIGELLVAKGFDVDVLEFSEVENLKSYSGFVIGAPIHGMKWLPEAKKFVDENYVVLENKNTACFLLSYILMEGQKFWGKKIAKSMNPTKVKIDPFAVGMFGGRIKEPLPAPMRFIFGIKKDAPLDARDWTAIEQWADKLAEYFEMNA